MGIARERLGKHVATAKDTYTRMNCVVCEGHTEERKTTGTTKSVLYGSLKKRGSDS
jgi:hypothetical protein